MSDAFFTPERLAALRVHPAFHEGILHHARGNLALYGRCSVFERWLISDLGRAALSAAALILDAMPGGLTADALYAGAAANRICSRGRVTAYLGRCELQGFLEPKAGGEAAERQLELTPKFLAPMVGALLNMLGAVTKLETSIAPALERLARLEEAALRRTFFAWLGALSATRPDLFNGPDKPVMLFLARDGGSRVLEHFLTQQPSDSRQLLASAPLSRSALARASFTSRTHVARLLEDGQSQALLTCSNDRVVFSPELSEDIERHYANMFELTRASALMALQGA